MTRRAILGIIPIGIIVAVAALVLIRHSHLNPKDGSATFERNAPLAASRPAPALYCDFYNFTHNATVVSFYFTVDLTHRAAPKFSELYVVEPDGTKTEFGGDSGSLPRWTYGIDEGFAKIESPDSAVAIVLYGLKPESGGAFWVEVGLRSNDYRNLEGKCRQVNFGEASTPDLPTH